MIKYKLSEKQMAEIEDLVSGLKAEIRALKGDNKTLTDRVKELEGYKAKDDLLYHYELENERLRKQITALKDAANVTEKKYEHAMNAYRVERDINSEIIKKYEGVKREGRMQTAYQEYDLSRLKD